MKPNTRMETIAPPGVKVIQSEIDGRRIQQQTVVCGRCGTQLPLSSGPNGPLAIEFMRHRVAKLGWLWSKRGRHLCPSCRSSRKGKKMPTVPPEQAPRTMAPADRRRLVFAIAEVYDDKNGRYVGDATDQSVATDLKCPRAWVEEIREAMFGPAGSNDEMRLLQEALIDLQKDAHGAMERALEAASSLEGLRNKARDLQLRVEKVETSVGPRRMK